MLQRQQSIYVQPVKKSFEIFTLIASLERATIRKQKAAHTSPSSTASTTFQSSDCPLSFRTYRASPSSFTMFPCGMSISRTAPHGQEDRRRRLMGCEQHYTIYVCRLVPVQHSQNEQGNGLEHSTSMLSHVLCWKATRDYSFLITTTEYCRPAWTSEAYAKKGEAGVRVDATRRLLYTSHQHVSVEGHLFGRDFRGGVKLHHEAKQDKHRSGRKKKKKKKKGTMTIRTRNAVRERTIRRDNSVVELVRIHMEEYNFGYILPVDRKKSFRSMCYRRIAVQQQQQQQ